MPDLQDQIRAYYEATTEPTDIDAIAVDPGTVLVGGFPDATQRRSPMKTLSPQGRTRESRAPWWRGPRLALAALIATVAVVAGVFAFVSLGSDDEVARKAESAAVLEAYRIALNTRDYDAIRSLLADDVVFTGHPVRPQTVVGVADVMVMERTSLSFAAPTNATEFYDVDVDGSVVTLSSRFYTEGGGCLNDIGHRVMVEDGKIARWDWGTEGECE